MTVIAVVAMGEMGAGFAQRLVERGARVLTSLAAGVRRARSAQSRRRHRDRRRQPDRRSRDVPLDCAAVGCRRDGRAVPAADREGRAQAGLYRLQRDRAANAGGIAKMFSDKGLPFLDGSIIGAAPRPTDPARASICPARSRARPRPSSSSGSTPGCCDRPRRGRDAEDVVCRHHERLSGAWSVDGARRRP